MDYIKDLVKLGSQEIVLDDNHKNVVLVLGNTGSGKSTLTHLLAGNNDNLIAKEVGKDTGEFIIEDLNDKISQNSTIFSKTIYPELVIDQKTEIGFYDCPGFSDTRNSSMDIANTYFIRRVIDHAETVKLLFTVNHNSLKIGMDRIDFMTLMKHATTLIKNIDKFENSIMLIATKVDNSYKIIGGTPTLVPDSNILANIEDFLNITKKDVESNLANDENLNKIQDAKIIKLIDILLTKNNNELSRIALFRRPDRPGKLTDIELTQNSKKNMNNIVHEMLQFSPKTIEDFGYTISEDTKNYIQSLIEVINFNINSKVKEVSTEILQYYQIDENLITDLYYLKDKFDLGSKNLTKIMKNINTNITQPKDLIAEFQNISMPISENLIKNITINEGDFNLLQNVTEKVLKYQTIEWKNILTETENVISNSKDLYNLFIILYASLSEYKVQSNLNNYSVSDLNKKIQIAFNNSESVKNIIKIVLDTVYTAGKWPESIKNVLENKEYMTIDDRKVKFLVKILENTLKSTTTVELLYGVFHVRGDLVRMSDVNMEISKLNNEKIRVLEIYALNKFFIDQDFTKKGDDFQFVVIAPTWEIIGNREIILDGNNADNWINAAEANKNGLPGIPGGPAGTFLGIGRNFFEIHNLIVTANGGQGGGGQDAGKKLDFDKPSICCDGCEIQSGANLDIVKDAMCNIPGNIGSQGNHGGAGGYGGPSGEIKLYQTKFGQEHLTISISTKETDGTRGSAGRGGNGQRGRLVIVKCQVITNCKIGGSGNNGINNVGIKSPAQRNKIGNIGPFIRRFQYNCNTLATNSLIKGKIIDFSNNLSNNKLIPNKNNRRTRRSLSKVQQYNYDSISSNFSLHNERITGINNSLLNYDNNEAFLKNNIVDFSSHNFNSTLALMDLISRKYLGDKGNFMANTTIQQPSYTDVLAKSLNIVDEYENILAKLSKNMKIEAEIDVNGLELVGKLQKITSNGNFAKISEILYDSVKINNKPVERKTEFGMKLQKMITKLLKKYKY